MAENDVPTMLRDFIFDVDVGPHWLAGEVSGTPATSWLVSDWRRDGERQVFELRGPNQRVIEVELRGRDFRVVSDSGRQGLGREFAH